jgi:hypothetical protein
LPVSANLLLSWSNFPARSCLIFSNSFTFLLYPSTSKADCLLYFSISYFKNFNSCSFNSDFLRLYKYFLYWLLASSVFYFNICSNFWIVASSTNDLFLCSCNAFFKSSIYLLFLTNIFYLSLICPNWSLITPYSFLINPWSNVDFLLS